LLDAWNSPNHAVNRHLIITWPEISIKRALISNIHGRQLTETAAHRLGKNSQGVALVIII
jgi:hypothetical protein